MPHELSQYVAELPVVDEWISADDRTLVFQVVDGDGNGVDIGTATVTWQLADREYIDSASNATITGDDSDVEIVTDNRVDTTNGEFEVRVDGSATSDLWGEYWQRPSVEQSDGTTASWIGEVELIA